MDVIDLSMPIEKGHFRWPVEGAKKGDFSAGDLFEVTYLHTSCHGFTHVDAPCHMVPGGAAICDLDLAKVIGPAAVIDVSGIHPEEEITVAHLSDAAAHLDPGEIALICTCWDEQRNWRMQSYWREAPWISRAACEWLLQRQPSAVAFDFPQDWTIRKLLDGEMRPIEEHVSHDVLLRNGITLIEYLINTRKISQPKTTLCALPLNIPNADGAPARVVAFDASELK